MLYEVITGVQPHAHTDGTIVPPIVPKQSTLGLDGTIDCIQGAWKSDKEGVTLGANLMTIPPVKYGPQQIVMFGQDDCVPFSLFFEKA